MANRQSIQRNHKSQHRDLPFEVVAARLRYEPETGHLIRIAALDPARVGKRAGGLISGGYRGVYLLGHKYLEHRVAWLLATGKWPVDQIDHINGDPADNRLVNLRQATNSQNNINKSDQVKGVSKHRGVWFDRRKNKWCAQIGVNGKRKTLGLFAKELDAARSYREAAEKIYGEFVPWRA